MRLVLIFLLSSLLLACMVVLAVWWTVAPYKTCYNKSRLTVWPSTIAVSVIAPPSPFVLPPPTRPIRPTGTF